MDRREQLVGAISPGSKSALELLGFLQHLSQDTAEGNLARVVDAAVELPVKHLRVDKSVLLCCPAPGKSYFPLAFRNVSHPFLENCHLLSGDDILDWAAINQSLKVVDDLPSLSTPSAGIYALEHVRSLACIPVVAQGETLAVLLYMCCSPVSFTIWELEVMNTIANHVAAVSRLKQADEERTPPQIGPLLVRLREALWTSTDLDELLNRTLREALTLMQADSGSIILHEARGCRVAATYGLSESISRELHRVKDTVYAHVIASQKPVLLHGAADAQEYPGAIPRPEIVSAMSVPLRGRRSLLGVLNINRSRAGRIFNDADLAFATSHIAQPLVMTIENLKLHEATKAQTRYLRDMYEIARTITSTLELDAVLNMIMNRLRALIVSDVCGLLLYDNETGRLNVACGYGIPDGTESDYAELMMIAGKLSPSRMRPLVIPDLSAHHLYRHPPAAEKLGLRSAVTVPLTIKRKRVGFLTAYRHEPRGFPRETVKLLIGMAELAAIAIENARLYERQLGIANLTQRLLSPSAIEPIPGFEVGCKYAPAYQVGGDYYDLIELDRHRFAIVIADVAGKDVSAARHIAMCKHSLRATAEHIASPAELLHKMNRLIYDNTEPEAFISMFYAILDTESKTLLYSLAGHEPGLLLRAHTGRIEYISTPGILLGVLPNATFFERRTSIKVGDILLLYTDGLTTALSSDGDTGLSKLESALMERPSKTAQELANNIHKLATSRRTSRPPDDIAIVALKGV